MPYQVRDARQPGHFWADNEIVDNHLPTIGVYGLAVYMLLARYADNKTGQCEPSVGHMAKLLGISDPTVRKALAKLSECKLIAVRHRKKERDGKRVNQTSVYTILAVAKGKPEGGTKPDLVGVLNQVDQGTKPDLVGVLNQVSSKKTIKTHEKDLESVARKARTPRKPAQATIDSLHEAVAIYKELTGKRKIPPVTAQQIAHTVVDLDHWRAVITAWCGRYRADNVTGMLEWYLDASKMTRQDNHGKPLRQNTGRNFERANWREGTIDDAI